VNANDAPEVGAALRAFSPQRWCVPCEVSWRGDDPCFCCARPGVASVSPPPDWPLLNQPKET